MLHEPPILFLDEPTSGVDPLSRRQFWDLIAQLSQQGTTVFVTTHYMEEAEYCDELALIYRGKHDRQGHARASANESHAGGHPGDPRGAALRGAGTAGEAPGWCSEAALFGDALHAVVDDAAAARRGAERFLAGEGSPSRRSSRSRRRSRTCSSR